MRIGLWIVAAVALLALPAASAARPTGGTVMQWTIDGVQRKAIVFAPTPTSTGAVKHPLIFAFHGHGGHAQGTALQMHLQTVWPQAIVVYPQGLNSPGTGPVDPAGTKPGWQIKVGDSNNRDLKLFDAMLATMKQHYKVDLRRIYTTGFSSGGVFSYLLWAERGKTIAAVGEVAGRLDDSETPATPRAVLAIAGKLDTTDLYAIQVASIERARAADHATGAGVACGPICTFYASPAGTNTPVQTLIHAGGHVYPPWAPVQIVKFLKAHPRP
jgi:polyhydroxybutyrate depolymerase